MKRVGVIGLGNMGSGIAKNLRQNGFETRGFDTDQNRMADFHNTGGVFVHNVTELAQNSDVVFVMVMNGAQAKSVILSPDGLAAHMPRGGCIILTATIKPQEAQDIGAALQKQNAAIDFIDSPVSGGFAGAQNGTLIMMAAAPNTVLDACAKVMQAISKTIHRVGQTAGEGQIVKACLQSLIGSVFAATFEAAALAAKAGVKGQVIYDVFAASSVGCGIVNTALKNIIDRQFEGTGSHINTMHKDLTIAMALAERLDVPMHTAASAMQIFHAGKSKYPNGDNWVCTRVIEDIIGAELHRERETK